MLRPTSLPRPGNPQPPPPGPNIPGHPPAPGAGGSRRVTGRHRLVRRALLLSILVGLPLLLASDAENPRQRRGETLYRAYCLNCHGAEGRGDGPMTEVLRSEVPDLTLLAARHDGTFPAEHVRQSIDGRYRVKGHGLREMPVWGLSFQQRGRPGDQEDEVQQRLGDLVEYLRSLQRPVQRRSGSGD